MSLIWCLAVLKTIHLCHLFKYICLFSLRCHGMCVEVRKLTWFFSHRVESQGLNSSHQVWWQVSFYPESQLLALNLIFFFFNFSMRMCCRTMLYLVPSETQRVLQIPWSCSQRQLWTTMWVLRNQPGCSQPLSEPSLIFFCLVAVLSNPEHFVPGQPELTAMVFEIEKSDVRAALLLVPEGLFLTDNPERGTISWWQQCIGDDFQTERSLLIGGLAGWKSLARPF